jgi:hypothetical protein
MSCCERVVSTFPVRRKKNTYRNSKVSVEEGLEVKGLVSLVAHVQHGLQTVLGQGDAVLQTKVVRPSLLHIVAEVVCCQTKVKTDRVIATLALVARL